MADLVADPPDIVFLSSSAQRFIKEPGDGSNAPGGISAAESAWTQSRASMIRRLQAAGSSVVLIDPLPKFSGWGPLTEGPFKEAPALTVLNGGSPYAPEIPRAQARAELGPAVAAENAAVAQTGAGHLQFFDNVCPGVVCSARNGDTWTYRDFEHLSVTTSQDQAQSFQHMAEQMMASRAP